MQRLARSFWLLPSALFFLLPRILPVASAQAPAGPPAPAAAQTATAETQLSPAELLQRMAATYASCKTYRDTGVVLTTFFTTDGTEIVEKPFSTAFNRPERFRYEYKEQRRGKLSSYIVWRGAAEDVRTWWDVRPGVSRIKSLNLGLAGATGVSSGSAHTVPVLLLPKELEGVKLTEMEDLKRLEDATHDERSCFRVSGRLLSDETILWLDRETLLIRKIETRRQFDNFRTEQTTTYRPVIDEEVPSEKLNFGAPAGE